MTNEIYTYEGKQYRLIYEPSYDDELSIAYEAYAICLQDAPYDDGTLPAYELYWYVKDEYIDYDPDQNGRPFLSPDCPDDDWLLADWEYPSGVIYCGAYDIERGEWC